MDKEKIDIKVISHIKVENHIEYLINISEKISGYNIYFPEKYQNLRSLYEQMKKESKSKQFPYFPPNKLFGYEEENFVIQRAKDLNNFFQEIISNKIFSSIPSFQKFITSSLQRNAIVNSEENDKKINANIIMNKNKPLLINYNPKFKKRSKLFKNSFYKAEKENFNLDKKEIENITNKFVNINYEIDINIKPKIEEKYKKIFDDINFTDNIKKNVPKNNNNNNLELIGKNNDFIEIAEKNINSYIKKNLEKFKSMTNIIEPENLLLK